MQQVQSGIEEEETEEEKEEEEEVEEEREEEEEEEEAEGWDIDSVQAHTLWNSADFNFSRVTSAAVRGASCSIFVNVNCRSAITKVQRIS